MSVYANDQRVSEVDACQYRVVSDGVQRDVYRSPGGWCGDQWIDCGWWYSDGSTTRSFATVDEAIRSLIGAPW